MGHNTEWRVSYTRGERLTVYRIVNDWTEYYPKRFNSRKRADSVVKKLNEKQVQPDVLSATPCEVADNREAVQAIPNK